MLFKKIADNSSPDSLATRLRRKRFSFFLSLISQLDRQITILDVGGTEQFWQVMGSGSAEGIHITLLNVEKYVTTNPCIDSVTGDARDLKFPDASFDVVFSNSVIEQPK
jgi:hypothetical protein